MVRQYMTANEVAQALGVSKSKAYVVIRQLNKQLEKDGYITLSGKINRVYFEEKCCYGRVVGE